MKKVITLSLLTIVTLTGCNTQKYCVKQAETDGCSLFSYGCNAPVKQHEVDIQTR